MVTLKGVGGGGVSGAGGGAGLLRGSRLAPVTGTKARSEEEGGSSIPAAASAPPEGCLFRLFTGIFEFLRPAIGRGVLACFSLAATMSATIIDCRETDVTFT